MFIGGGNMEILKQLLYLLIFPGFVFSTVVGLFLAGLDRKIVARMQRRRGPKITQPFYDFIKLIGKDTIIPRNASGRLFLFAPIIALVGISIIPIFIPIYNQSFVSSTADIIVIIYLLVIPVASMIMGGMASASPLASIGVSREVVSMIAYELPLIITLLAVCKKTGAILGYGTSYSLKLISEAQQLSGSFMFTVALLPAAIALLMILPAKIGVSPFDVAEAETEICEGPLAEYSGLQLGLFKLTHNIKIYVMTALFVALFLGGVGINTGIVWIDLIVNTIIMLLLVTIISILSLSVVRGLMGRYKTHQMFKFYWTVPTILSLLSYALVSLKL